MRLHRIKYCLFLTAIVLAGIVKAQNLSIETVVDTNQISFGEQVGIHYKIEMNKDIELQLPSLKAELIEGVELVVPPAIDTIRLGDNKIGINIDLVVTVFDTGLFYIPPQAFAFKDGLFSDTAYSTASYLAVAGIQIDESGDIRDIKDPMGAPISVWLLLAIIFFSPFIIGLVGYGIYVLFFQKSGEAEYLPEFVKPTEAYHITALRELDRIKVQKLWQQKQVKEYYTRITYIIRWLVGKSFQIPALEETTDEILRHVKSRKIDAINFQHLEDLLNLADLVKFAKGEPDPEENIRHLDNAYDFVKTMRDDAERSDKNVNQNSQTDSEDKA